MVGRARRVDDLVRSQAVGRDAVTDRDARGVRPTGLFLDQRENRRLVRELALVAETRQPCDHPISLQFKEGRYLKAMVLRRLS